MFTRFFILSVVPIALFLLTATPASATPVFRAQDQVLLTEDQAVSSDFYAVGGTVESKADIEGDVVMIGGKTAMVGTSGGDILFVSGTASVRGAVADDVRILSGTVEIGNKVAGDLVVLGGELRILPTAEVGGDVLFYGGSLIVEGTVKGSVVAEAETVRIDTLVQNDVRVKSHLSLTLGSRASVQGAIYYKSPSEIIRAPESLVVGSIQRTETPSGGLGIPLTPLLMLLFSALLVRFVSAPDLTRYLAHVIRTPLRSLVVGCVALIGIPLLIILLFVSVLGSVLGVILLSAYIAFLGMALVLAGALSGAGIAMIATGKPGYTFGWIIIGTVMLYALCFLPLLGLLCILLAMMALVGGAMTMLYDSYRH
jgi:cytoskeletal protein CcmA (bactofilin family)